MPWCPKCKGEYREGFTVCADCNEPLADLPPSEWPPESEREPRLMEPVYLATAENTLQSGMLVELLEESGISVLVKNRSVGGYTKVAWGFSVTGDDLYVDRSQLAQAQELTRDFLLPQETPGSKEPAPIALPSSGAGQRVIAWIMVSVLLLSFLGSMIVWLFQR
ncbi:MAG: DUF2007 domain-containing protein [Oscillospiraceae bacterium]